MTDDTATNDPLSRAEESAFRALTRAMVVLPRALDADLIREQKLPLVEYLALVHLSEAPERQLRMKDLAADCNLSLSGMTRVANRLEAEGFIERVTCASDARGSNATLTDHGLDRLKQAYPTHLASVRRHVTDHWQDVDLTQLAKALGDIAR